LVFALAVGCVPPGGGGPTVPTDPLPGGGPPVPGTPNGITFLAGKPAPGQTYDGSASRVQISANGLWVVYHHGAENLALTNKPPAGCPKPPGPETQIYRTNLVSGATELVSRAPNGCYANGESTFPDVSADGRFVVFSSRGTNLVPDGNGQQQDVFLKDMATGVTSIASITGSGAAGVGGSSSRPDISEDGNTIAYSSDATNLVPGDRNGQEDCFVTSRANLRSVRLVSLGSGGQALNGPSYRCQLSANGSMMVFASFAGNATGSSLSQGQRIYVRNLRANTTTLVSRRPNGTPALASRPDISGSGACVTYQSKDAGIVPGDPDTTDDVFLFDMARGTTRMMSLDSNGNHVTAASNRIVVNGNCTRVAFVSVSNRLVTGDRNSTRDTFMRDVTSGAIFLLSVSSAEQPARPCQTKTPSTTTTLPGTHDPTGAEDISTRPSLSDDGLVVAFISDVCGLVPEEAQMAGWDGVIIRWMR
jgi:Tol biopolymer transport system component